MRKNFQNRVRIPSVFRIEGEEDKTASHKSRKPLALQALRGVPGIQVAFQIQKTIEVGGGTDPKPEPGSDPINPPSNIESVNIMQRYKKPLSFTGYTITIKNVQKDGTIESYHRGSGFRPSENNMDFLDTEKGPDSFDHDSEFCKGSICY